MYISTSPPSFLLSCSRDSCESFLYSNIVAVLSLPTASSSHVLDPYIAKVWLPFIAPEESVYINISCVP